MLQLAFELGLPFAVFFGVTFAIYLKVSQKRTFVQNIRIKVAVATLIGFLIGMASPVITVLFSYFILGNSIP